MASERDLDLIRASAAGDAERMRALLGRGAKVNARMKNGATALLAAAVAGRIEALQLLLLQGADLKARYRDEATVLVMAATQGHANVVQLLLQKGASHHERTRTGVTPLLAAAIEGHGAVVEALLAAGADPNAADARGVTPLIGAAVNGRMEALCALRRSRSRYRRGEQIGSDGAGGGGIGDPRGGLGAARKGRRSEYAWTNRAGRFWWRRPPAEMRKPCRCCWPKALGSKRWIHPGPRLCSPRRWADTCEVAGRCSMREQIRTRQA